LFFNKGVYFSNEDDWLSHGNYSICVASKHLICGWVVWMALNT